MARDSDELDPREDPTRITNQPSLTTSSGRVWFIVGGLFAAISIATLYWIRNAGAPGVAWFAIVAIVLLYVAMIVVAIVAGPGRRRLGWLAVLMLVMAAVALGSVIVIMLSSTGAR